ncbi:MAG: DUF3857 domain-containing protein, partial [Chitinophagaceae bacterium]|nr:DUF3857 domain-containing protein [Chitinophagaceae bacterium]
MGILKLIQASSTLCTFLLLLQSFCQAQTQVSDFGNFTPEDIQLRRCEFDKDADAVVLLDKASSTYSQEYNLVTERRIRFKILKENGIHRANIYIRYYSGDQFEVIRGIDAVVMNYDEQQKMSWSKVDRKSIYNKKLNSLYSEITFAVPNVKVGSIIEYKYESTMQSYAGLREWYFQTDMPVILSSYNVTVLPNAEFAYSIYKSSMLPITIKPDEGTGSILFEMKNIPALRDEPYMTAARDYLQRVNFQISGYKDYYGKKQFSTSWNLLARELLDNSSFGGVINKSLPNTDALKLALTKAVTPFEKLKTIYEYVRSSMTWNDIYSKYADEGIKNAWEKKKGTSAEINLILIN